MAKKLSNNEFTFAARKKGIIQGMESVCPALFTTVENLNTKPLIEGLEGSAFVVSCGATGLSTMYVMVEGTNDYFSLIWIEMGEPTGNGFFIDKKKWRKRLAQLQPLELRAMQGGEDVPMVGDEGKE